MGGGPEGRIHHWKVISKSPLPKGTKLISLDCWGHFLLVIFPLSRIFSPHTLLLLDFSLAFY